MNESDQHDDLAERVSRSVAHALALVGPAENGAERPSDDRAAELTVS
jgi:hypothetical protein